MTDGPAISTAGLDPRRKKLLYRAWHRGMKEMDILMGNFADAHIQTMQDVELDELELLIEVPDQHLFTWITGTQAVPENYNGPIYQKMCAFYAVSEMTEAR